MKEVTYLTADYFCETLLTYCPVKMKIRRRKKHALTNLQRKAFLLFIEGRVEGRRHAFPPTGIIFSLLGLDIEIESTALPESISSRGCKHWPTDDQEGRESGHQDRTQAASVSVLVSL